MSEPQPIISGDPDAQPKGPVMSAEALPAMPPGRGASANSASAAGLPDPRRWRALGVLALIQFMLVLDITVVNVALPHIQKDLGFSRAGLTWVVDGYTLTAGGLLLLGGRLADLLGRRRMFFAGVLLFTLASAVSGAAQSPGMLVASRFVQGAGEALASPAAFGLVVLLFTDPVERTKAVGMFGGVAGLGGTLGPVLSGLLIRFLDWRWIFYINIPIAIFCAAAVWRLVDESRADEAVRTAAGQRPDIEGALLGTAGLTGVVFGLIEAANHAWGDAEVVAPLVLGVALMGAFVLRERLASDPLVPLRFFRNRTRVTSNLVTFFFFSAFFTMFFLLTLYWQEVQGWSALKTGIAYLPFGVIIGVGIALSTILMPRIGVRPLLGTGFVLFAIGELLLARIGVHGDYAGQVLPAMVLMAIGSGMSFPAFGVASVHEVSGEDASLASGVQNAVQNVGGAVGLATLATIALRHAATATRHGVNPATASTDGFRLAFEVGAVVMAVGAVLVFVLLEKVRPESDAAPATDAASAAVATH